MAMWDSLTARYHWFFDEAQRASREAKDLDGLSDTDTPRHSFGNIYR
jgi:hypothetical protein